MLANISRSKSSSRGENPLARLTLTIDSEAGERVFPSGRRFRAADIGQHRVMSDTILPNLAGYIRPEADICRVPSISALMTQIVRRLSRDGAASEARALAIEFAKTSGMEGGLLDVQPDSMRSERDGKRPVHWAAVFTSVHKGVEFDGPTVLLVDLRARKVAFSE